MSSGMHRVYQTFPGPAPEGLRLQGIGSLRRDCDGEIDFEAIRNGSNMQGYI